MTRCFALLLLGLSSAALAEDAAHRADRLRTEALNRRAMASARSWQRGNDDKIERYRQARARYERLHDEWRERVAACNRGYWSACD
jgi:hypothetical protein